MSVEGFWKVEIATPLGTRRTTLELFSQDGILQGISRGEKEELILQDVQLAGNQLSWYQNIKKPMRMKLVFDVVVDGDEMTGTARGGPMPAAKVSGHRAPATQAA